MKTANREFHKNMDEIYEIIEKADDQEQAKVKIADYLLRADLDLSHTEADLMWGKIAIHMRRTKT